MNVCVYVPAGPLSEAVRDSIKNVFAGPAINLGDLPPTRWKETVASADCLVADITAQNAAASYLVGIADALGKRAILLAPIEESVPPVFAQRSVILHQWNLEHLRGELRKLTPPSAADNSLPPEVLDYTPAGKFQQSFGDLLKAHGYVHRGVVEFDGATFTLREQEMELPLVQAIANRAKSLNLRVRLL